MAEEFSDKPTIESIAAADIDSTGYALAKECLISREDIHAIEPEKDACLIPPPQIKLEQLSDRDKANVMELYDATKNYPEPGLDDQRIQKVVCSYSKNPEALVNLVQPLQELVNKRDNYFDFQVRYWPNFGDTGRALYIITPNKHALHRYPTNDCYIS